MSYDILGLQVPSPKCRTTFWGFKPKPKMSYDILGMCTTFWGLKPKPKMSYYPTIVISDFYRHSLVDCGSSQRYLSVCLSVCLPVCPAFTAYIAATMGWILIKLGVAPPNFICQSVCLSVCLSRFYGLYRGYYGLDFDQTW